MADYHVDDACQTCNAQQTKNGTYQVVSSSNIDNLTTQPTTMENSLNYLLLPVEDCAICGDAFGTTHHPAALPCKHIFGHACIEKWFNNGKGNNRACPTCRFVVVVKKESPEPPFTVSSIWAALTEQPLDRLHAFMRHIWNRLQMLWQQTPDGNFTVTQILEGAIIPALLQTGRETLTTSSLEPGTLVGSPILQSDLPFLSFASRV
ncbi:hypothetical protein LEMA_P088450.1 [Plenodomus lingam JN3]|uniref:RING-type domain-containing protein n=1 Tax=Leptosphaeria maculans (strain JN3 / isolate v23.1.3 / race Av1-4-5-6-7-8) TaxID=985895 RepID=E5A7L1_LEPMJ|nr:hypothetical protein LEMA_P088450.1 [Plenodomus lingam JN3]CBX99606.1 hypothetical protein LEMA_P088450.1 [Plenodomus lingam JN3]